MTRTPSDTGRRRSLADASNGLPTGRARVVLYACVADGRDPDTGPARSFLRLSLGLPGQPPPHRSLEERNSMMLPGFELFGEF
ncbi:hypothetical protein [Streptomyces sp. NPDC056682]|uniref:hypothetical protein n=1 Tax=Streptomyces sp. NPDC056682 TaxID=3345909 RepID=UPI0036B85903